MTRNLHKLIGSKIKLADHSDINYLIFEIKNAINKESEKK